MDEGGWREREEGRGEGYREADNLLQRPPKGGVKHVATEVDLTFMGLELVLKNIVESNMVKVPHLHSSPATCAGQCEGCRHSCQIHEAVQPP